MKNKKYFLAYAGKFSYLKDWYLPIDFVKIGKSQKKLTFHAGLFFKKFGLLKKTGKNIIFHAGFYFSSVIRQILMGKLKKTPPPQPPLRLLVPIFSVSCYSSICNVFIAEIGCWWFASNIILLAISSCNQLYTMSPCRTWPAML